MSNSMYQSDVIYVNGVKMTLKEFKSKFNSAKKPKRSKKEKTEIQKMPSSIKALVRNAGPIKSLAAYYDNGYKQWGRIAKTIIELPQIYPNFLSFRTKAYDLSKIINDITVIGKHDEKAIFGYIQKLSWKLDDIKNAMNSLYKGVCESGVLEHFADRECINGTKRRLGLSILMDRTFLSIDKMSETIAELNKIASNGVDAMDYIGVDKNRSYRLHR